MNNNNACKKCKKLVLSGRSVKQKKKNIPRLKTKFGEKKIPPMMKPLGAKNLLSTKLCGQFGHALMHSKSMRVF
jgi:hypothetical protein